MTDFPSSPETATLRKALEKAREEIVLAVAFLGRDLFTDRLNDTADSLVTRLAKADADARAALAFDHAQYSPERIAELQYEAGMYKSLYENAIERCAQVCEGHEWTRYAMFHSPTKSCAIAIRALADTSTDRPSLDQLLDGMTEENRHEEVPVSSPTLEDK